ncbi:MAG TPA: hypothetical protein VFG86_27820, partial [Chloroflexota bacterium]|nr:hypothetical protein [Chloroflexota bacterium]
MSVDPESVAPEPPLAASTSPPAAGTDANRSTASAPAVETTSPPTGKRGFTFPSAYTVLFLLLIVVAALTWIIPAGQYDRQDGQPVPN